MAHIKPLRAWRYSIRLTEQLPELFSPLYDVVSEEQKKILYQKPNNSLHLSAPQDGSAATAKKTFDQWKENKIIEQDALPTLYVLYQYFKIPGSEKQYCRKGFICHIRAHDWEEEIVIRHEHTVPKTVAHQIELLDTLQLHTSATHGLYMDPSFELEPHMDDAIATPVYDVVDYQGVRQVIGLIHDVEVIKKFIRLLGTKQVIIADGHHRYTSSLQLAQEKRKSNPAFTGEEGFNFNMMYLTNAASDDLVILPTHRLLQNLYDYDPELFKENLTSYFDLSTVKDPLLLPELIAGEKHCLGIIFKDEYYTVTLKDDLPIDTRDLPEEIKELDLSLLNYYIIEKALGIPAEKQVGSPHIRFQQNLETCLYKVETEEADMAIITKPVTIAETQKVCAGKNVMPQKSTFFYPKVICGLLFGSIQENEFSSVGTPLLILSLVILSLIILH